MLRLRMSPNPSPPHTTSVDDGVLRCVLLIRAFSGFFFRNSDDGNIRAPKKSGLGKTLPELLDLKMTYWYPDPWVCTHVQYVSCFWVSPRLLLPRILTSSETIAWTPQTAGEHDTSVHGDGHAGVSAPSSYAVQHYKVDPAKPRILVTQAIRNASSWKGRSDEEREYQARATAFIQHSPRGVPS